MFRVLCFSLLFIGCVNSIFAIDFFSSKAIYTRTMTNEWGTLCLPFDVHVRGEDSYTLYKLKSVSDDTVIFEPYSIGDMVAAGTPCLIHKEGSLELRIVQDSLLVNPNDVNSYSEGEWRAKGTFVKQSVENDGAYYMAKNKLWLKSQGSPLTVKPFCAWFEVEQQGQARLRSYNIGLYVDNTNRIDRTFTCPDDYFMIYDVSGRPLPSLRTGINIVVTAHGTKKILIK